MAEFKTEHIALSKLKANPNNPRVVKDDKFKKLVKSIQDFPQMLEIRPIVVNEDMIVLGGNMRLKACKEAGLKQVPVIKASELTEEQQREFIIKDNVGYGEWDWDELANTWDAEQIQEWGLDIPSFGHDVNNMSEDDLSLTEEFDPLGNTSDLHRLVFLFDTENDVQDWIKGHFTDGLDIKKFAGKIWQVNYSLNYGK